MYDCVILKTLKDYLFASMTKSVLAMASNDIPLTFALGFNREDILYNYVILKTLLPLGQKKITNDIQGVRGIQCGLDQL